MSSKKRKVSKMSMKKRNMYNKNHNAHIKTREVNGRVETRTAGRDEDSTSANIFTEKDRTILQFVTPNGAGLALDGRAARTLYRMLAKHYEALGTAE